MINNGKSDNNDFEHCKMVEQLNTSKSVFQEDTDVPGWLSWF